MRWYKEIQNILSEEPEVWLVYLLGQQLDNIPHLTRKKPKLTGWFVRLMGHLFFLLRNIKFWQPACIKGSVDYLFFSGTENQFLSLVPTIEELDKNDCNTVEVVLKKKLKPSGCNREIVVFGFTVLDVLKSMILLVRNGKGLYRDLRERHPSARHWYFNDFCNVYAYLAYFHRVIKKTKPDFVVTANDHNPPNRALLAVAHYLGVETVYMQHASVSPLFPALRVNYAFLDGAFARDVYRTCEINQPSTERKVPSPEVILSGQKKCLKRSLGQSEVIGVALNALDAPDEAVRFVEALLKEGKKVCVRWHPGLASGFANKYMASFSGIDSVLFSDPQMEPASDFMGKIGFLVAGNSSIHLEAALTGVLPIYLELTPADSPDYYGYVENGLAIPARGVRGVIEIVNEYRAGQYPNAEAVRYYSSTYLTEWDGREGELVAMKLMELKREKFSKF